MANANEHRSHPTLYGDYHPPADSLREGLQRGEELQVSLVQIGSLNGDYWSLVRLVILGVLRYQSLLCKQLDGVGRIQP